MGHGLSKTMRTMLEVLEARTEEGNRYTTIVQLLAALVPDVLSDWERNRYPPPNRNISYLAPYYPRFKSGRPPSWSFGGKDAVDPEVYRNRYLSKKRFLSKQSSTRRTLTLLQARGLVRKVVKLRAGEVGWDADVDGGGAFPSGEHLGRDSKLRWNFRDTMKQ